MPNPSDCETMIEPRAYQQLAIRKAQDAYRCGKRAIILAGPTGCGKTAIASQIIRGAIERYKRVIFFVGSLELLDQTSRHLTELDIPYGQQNGHGIIHADDEYLPECTCQVATIQTWWSWKKRLKAPSNFDLSVIDECDWGGEGKMRNAAWDCAPCRIGLTATPIKPTGKPLGKPWDELITVATYDELINHNPAYLVPAECYCPNVADWLDMRKYRVDSKTGDWTPKAMALLSEKMKRVIVGHLAESWERWGHVGPWLVFALDLGHSIFIRDSLRAAGVSAEHVDGNTLANERREIISRARSGQLQVLTNFRVFGRGTDIPNVATIVNFRPFGSIGPYRQAFGRGLRTSPGKDRCLFIDHTGSVIRFGYPDEDVAWSLDGENCWQKHAETWAHKNREQAVCPVCGHYFEHRPPCKCGWMPQRRGQGVIRLEGSLTHLSRKTARKTPPMTDRLREWQRIVNMCRYSRRPKTVAQARIIFKRRTGDWPSNELEPRLSYNDRELLVRDVLGRAMR